MNANGIDRPESQIDEAAALAALADDRKLLADLALMFCEDAPDFLEQLERAVAREDATEARRAAHSLKGLASTFFAEPTIEVAQRLENEAASGRLEMLRNGGIRQLEDSILGLISELKRAGLIPAEN